MYIIDETIEGDFSDYYASYNLVAEGSTPEELLEDAHIFEVDQDGGSGNDYKLESAHPKLYKIASEIIESKEYME